MEYIQTILFQVAASRLEQASEAGGLISELDEHRNFLKQQPGFRDLRVTRSINSEGNVLVVVETRWSDDESLVRYETSEPNAASIVRKHQDVIVRDSLQVLDMEALRTETSFARSEMSAAARARLVFPLIVPAGVLAFALLTIYGLSRIYLALDKNAAVGLAAGIAIGVLLIAGFLASNPRVTIVQIGGIFALVIAALIGGTTWALIEGSTGGEAGEHAVESPAASPGASPGAGNGGALTIAMHDNYFDFNGQKAPSVSVAAAGKETTIDLDNEGQAIHNMHVANASGDFPDSFCKPTGATPCSDPNTVAGGEKATVTFTLPAGSYPFRCDFHPAEMTGTLVVQ